MQNNTINTICHNSNCYIQAIKHLFEICFDPKIETDYSAWKKAFVKIHGELNTQHKINYFELEKTFNISLLNNPDRLFHLVFCLETYYSVILRIIAYKAVYKDTGSYSHTIFESKPFLDKRILNYSCINYYNWFLFNEKTTTAFSDLYTQIEPHDNQNDDIISHIFETIFPKEIRHSLGEYYTPYWLALYMVESITEKDDNKHLKTYIDPSCGSGVFLTAIIHKFKNESCNSIFKNICGIDINPLAVLAAKTNYLLLYSTISNFEEELMIPIFCADTIAINDTCPALFNEETSFDEVPKIEYDYIVGNPPWVNWEYLPKYYKEQHGYLWKYYNLFNQKGLNANFIKEDVSVLMTYVAVDNYLKQGGKLGFVIKETLFKSVKQGEGFRNFRIYPKKTELNVYKVEDLTKIKPFKDAMTRTALLYLQKGEKTCYPIDYIVWHPKNGRKVADIVPSPFLLLSEQIEFERIKARPSITTSLNSGWITEHPKEMLISEQVLGSNCYTARTGVFTGGANGIYWLKIGEETPSGNIIVSNITEKAKNKVQNITAEIEKDYVFPLLTGNELGFWNYSYSKYILCPHTPKSKMKPIDSSILKTLPKTEAYLQVFKEELESRKGFTSLDEQIHHDYYYTLQRIGEYTFSKYKVCWKYISKNFIPAVVEYADDLFLGKKNIICNEKIVSIGLNDRDEAFYLCGIISSTPYRKTIENFMIGTQITPSIINKIKIPLFNKNNEQHIHIANLCMEGHTSNEKSQYTTKIDEIVNNCLLAN